MRMKTAQILMECLLEQGVDTVFGYPGGTILNVYDEFELHGYKDKIRHILTAHEQGASHAADGYARSTGKAGVVIATSGPGATNLVTGIATAYMDSIPMVAITGNVAVELLGRDSFQEVDITGAVAPFSKHSYLVKNANDIPRVVREAFHIASTGRPGPVLIDIPIDVQEQTLKKFDWPEEVNIRGYKPSVKGNDLQIKRVVETIAKARQPLICAGGGVWLADAQEELLELAKAGTDWRPAFSCPDGSPCKRGDAFLRHDLDCFCGELCKGETCCLRCPKAKTAYYACERMCSKAKAARKLQREEDEAIAAKREAEIQAKIRENVQLRAKRLAAAADAAGLDDNSPIYISDYGRSMTAGKLREWAAGQFAEDDRLYPSTLSPKDYSDPARLAEELGCSTDYLLGVTDHLTSAALSTATDLEADGPWRWWPEQPQESGLYWCITGPMSHGGSLYWWNAEEEQWEHPAMAFRMSPTVTLWMKCPQLPDSMSWERQEVQE